MFENIDKTNEIYLDSQKDNGLQIEKKYCNPRDKLCYNCVNPKTCKHRINYNILKSDWGNKGGRDPR